MDLIHPQLLLIVPAILTAMSATLPKVLCAGCLAYTGPGAGLSFINSLIAVVCVLGLALIAPLLYPIRVYLRWRKKRLAAQQIATSQVSPDKSTQRDQTPSSTTSV